MHGKRRYAALLAAGLGLSFAAPARAEDAPARPPPALTMKIKDTLDIWRNVTGGVAVGNTSLDKLQVGATLDGAAFGRPGFTAHLSIFKTNAESLSGSRTGDIQTASNIEALSTVRLFELWAEQHFGRADAGGLVARAGLMDLNGAFDSIGTAGLFLNSSHGIAPDLSRSGRNGPSIFPVSSAGVQLAWTAGKDWTLKGAAFDGVPGDPAHPKAFATVRLSRADGALLIAQADYAFAGESQASFGIWGYTAPLPSVAAPDRLLNGRPGVYGFVEAPAPALWNAKVWLRAGVADSRVQSVSGYLGAGAVWTSPLPGRGDDQLGIAVAHAVIGRAVRRAMDLPAAETTWEATYSFHLSDAVQLQPDVQYIVHPSLAPHLPDALAVGLRIVAQFKRPGWAPPDDS